MDGGDVFVFNRQDFPRCFNNTTTLIATHHYVHHTRPPNIIPPSVACRLSPVIVLVLVLVVAIIIVSSSSSSIRWEVLVEVIQMPWQLKTMWHERLQGLVEDWIGGEELERTVTITKTHARTRTHTQRTDINRGGL